MPAESNLLMVYDLFFEEVAKVMVLGRRLLGILDQALDVLVLVLVPVGSLLLKALLSHALYVFQLLEDVAAAPSQS